MSEAIRALRLIGGGRDRWLTDVLQGRDELRELSERVQAELSGEAC